MPDAAPVIRIELRSCALFSLSMVVVSKNSMQSIEHHQRVLQDRVGSRLLWRFSTTSGRSRPTPPERNLTKAGFGAAPALDNVAASIAPREARVSQYRHQ